MVKARCMDTLLDEIRSILDVHFKDCSDDEMEIIIRKIRDEVYLYEKGYRKWSFQKT
jgi:hypothetical protein